MNRIAAFGDNCVDYYDETKEAHFGGNPVNVAVYLARMGRTVSYLGAVGTDAFGKAMTQALEAQNIDISHVRVSEGTTACTHVTIRNGNRVLGDYEEGVMADYALEPEDLAFMKSHDLAVTGLWGHCENDLKILQEAGVFTVFDAADRPDDPAALAALPGTDIFFFSDGDDRDDTGVPDSAEGDCENAGLRERLRALQQQGPRLVVATRGEKGSMAFDGQHYYSCGIIPCRVVDTMGAGDSYIAGFINAWLDGLAVSSCMEAGAASSARTLSCAGAW